jgi:hypothetical protein
MSINKDAEMICEKCDGILAWPDLIYLEDNPEATIGDYQIVVDGLKAALEEIWRLAGRIWEETQHASPAKLGR